MPRQLRIEYPGALYHVMNRGDRREEIFLEDADRVRFLETLGECCGKRVGRFMPIASCQTTFTSCWKPLRPIWWLE